MEDRYVMKYLALSMLLGFTAVMIGTPYAKRYLLLSGIFGVDQQKKGKPKLATSGGIVVLFGLLISITSYMVFARFSGTDLDIGLVLAALNSAIIIGLIGLIDDIHVDLEAVIQEEMKLSEDFSLEIKEKVEDFKLPHQNIWSRTTGNDGGGETLRKGLGQATKMLFVLPAALPLVAVGAGSYTMHFPFIGSISWGLLYPFLLLPLGLLFVGNVVNMLAGMNGLSASLSLVASTALGVYALKIGRLEAAVISLGFSATLLGFLYYNFYPASILPGDSFTYLSGAVLFSTIVIGDMEKFGIFIFAPWFAEFFLKLRSGFQARSWGDLRSDGTLETGYDNYYSLTHPLMEAGLDERQVTLALTATEILICSIAILLFTGGII